MGYDYRPFSTDFYRLMGIHRSVDADISASSVLSHYGRVIPITLLTVLMMLLIVLGVALLVIPRIYLAIAYYDGSTTHDG
ncbi:MAG: hypothetical protein KZQ70_09775 [gamma proteobacterium symbiont of Lucinoma myriamae]|nr:hypothetical protein [gamma proteobacterium symbiont of Lucinoma myriamae]MCU7817512.1 hypothetical protein [gamma proteobacterium symbiont of Lucinoma myriamae]MCU7832778.1 hypothetical protein [gamma proteobacterium symbiont of Lucinoma myriamae]